MKFKYKARNKTGELQVGFVEGADRSLATNILISHGLFVLSVEDAESHRWYDRLLGFLNRVRPKDLMIFSRQFSTLLSAKVPLNDILLTIRNQTSNQALKEVVAEIAADVDAGLSLSQAMEKHNSVFSVFYVNMIRAAEVTGRVEEAAAYLADYIEKQNTLVSKVKGALMYPIIMVALFLVVGGIITTVVLPQIGPIFEESNVELPFITRILVSSGEFLASWWWFVLFGLGFIVFVFIDYFRTPEGRVVIDELFLRTPGVSTLLKQLHVARLSDSLAVLLKGAVPVAQAVEITGQTIGSAAYKDLLQQVAEDVRRGELLSQSLSNRSEFFPPFVSQMVAIGEKTGRLEELLGRVSTFYTQEVNKTVNNLVELIQPLLMVFIGVMVGGLFASILIPIYNLVQTF